MTKLRNALGVVFCYLSYEQLKNSDIGIYYLSAVVISVFDEMQP
jgi:hypothetical protein